MPKFKSLKGLRVYLAEGDAAPFEVPPPSLPPISAEDIELLCWLGTEPEAGEEHM